MFRLRDETLVGTVRQRVNVNTKIWQKYIRTSPEAECPMLFLLSFFLFWGSRTSPDNWVNNPAIARSQALVELTRINKNGSLKLLPNFPKGTYGGPCASWGVNHRCLTHNTFVETLAFRNVQQSQLMRLFIRSDVKSLQMFKRQDLFADIIKPSRFRWIPEIWHSSARQE